MKKYILPIIIFLIACFLFVIYKGFSKDDVNREKITVAEVTHSVFYAPFYVAIENGYFSDENIDVELVLTPGADNVMAAVLSGDANIGLSGSEATIYVYNGGEKDYIKTFAQLTQKDGSFIVSRKNIEDFSLDDLKDKYVIGGRVGGMPLMIFEWSLREAGIDPNNDLTIDTSISFANMASSFISGTGDFVNLFEPLASSIVNQGYGYKVASLGEYGGNVPYTAFNARCSYIDNNKRLIETFTEVIQKGLDYVSNNSSNDVAKVIKKQFPDNSLEDIISSIDSYKSNDTWPNNTTFTKESFDHLQDIIISSGMLDSDDKVSYSDLVYVK